MQWIEPEPGAVRIKTRFLLLPKNLPDNDCLQSVTKWMEKASWYERYEDVGFNYYGDSIYNWVPMYWTE